MSLFESLKNAIFHHNVAPAVDPKAAPPGTVQTAGASPINSPDRAAGTQAVTPKSAPSQVPPGARAPQANAGQQTVDVEAVLNDMSGKSQQKLNWRTSIVDLMKLVGLDPSLQHRKELAAELGYHGDTNDSAAMNVWLHKEVMKKLAANGGQVPADLQH